MDQTQHTPSAQTVVGLAMMFGLYSGWLVLIEPYVNDVFGQLSIHWYVLVGFLSAMGVVGLLAGLWILAGITAEEP